MHFQNEVNGKLSLPPWPRWTSQNCPPAQHGESITCALAMFVKINIEFRSVGAEMLLYDIELWSVRALVTPKSTSSFGPDGLKCYFTSSSFGPLGPRCSRCRADHMCTRHVRGLPTCTSRPTCVPKVSKDYISVHQERDTMLVDPASNRSLTSTRQGGGAAVSGLTTRAFLLSPPDHPFIHE